MTNVIEQHRDEVVALCRRAGARRLDVFGSAARADFDPATSDLDFYVEFDELPPTKYADAYFTLKESLEIALRPAGGPRHRGQPRKPVLPRSRYAERQSVYAR